VPPASVAHQEWITRTAHDSTSVSALFKARKGITEHAPARQGPVKGTGAARVSSDPSNDEASDDISGVTAPLNGIGVPATPQAPGPNGGTITETATGGGSNIHGGGGGGLPPTSNGACEPGEGDGTIAARSVRFTQDSISANFKNGTSVMQLGEDLANGTVSATDLPGIRLFEQDGDLYSLDNRRLLAGQMADVDLSYRMATQQELNKEVGRKFTTTNQGTGIRVRGVGDFSWFNSCDG
jgi:hypothetical protein